MKFNYFKKNAEIIDPEFSFNFISSNINKEQLQRNNFSRIFSRRNGIKQVDRSHSQLHTSNSIRLPKLQASVSEHKTEKPKIQLLEIKPIQTRFRLYTNGEISQTYGIDDLQGQKRAYCIQIYRKQQQQRLFQELILKNQNIRQTIQIWVETHKNNEIVL